MNLEQALRATEQQMLDAVASDVPVLQEASRHIISAGGKRVRPRLMFLSYLVAGGSTLGNAIPVAAALELVHTATLVHDDINDHGKVRRGQVTINERWGRTFALLTGDFLFAKVYEMMAPYGDLNKTFSETAVTLVEGETLQADAAKNNRLNREVYKQIVAKKTASLFQASAVLGAQLAGADDEMVDALGEYGFHVGLAFQIVDDILDLVGDPSKLGKTAGIDAVQGKGVMTAYATNGASNGSTTAVAEAPAPADNMFDAMKQKMLESGAVDEGWKMARLSADMAHAALDRLPESALVDELRDIITLVLDRDR
ncbi:MAG: polyprenyl synthetase family protein [Chloroflexi bacterium]|nr:polyprenyl synthetase family protein [Chloroflexota bacterium]